MESGRSKSLPSRGRVPRARWPALWLAVTFLTGGTVPMWEVRYRDGDGQVRGRPDGSLWAALAYGPGTGFSVFRHWPDDPNPTRLALLLIFSAGPLATYPLWHPPTRPEGAADY